MAKLEPLNHEAIAVMLKKKLISLAKKSGCNYGSIEHNFSNWNGLRLFIDLEFSEAVMSDDMSAWFHKWAKNHADVKDTYISHFPAHYDWSANYYQRPRICIEIWFGR